MNANDRVIAALRGVFKEFDRMSGGNLWDVNVRLHRDHWFRWDFNGFLICEVRFHPNGAVTENVDAFPTTYASIAAWIANCEEVVKSFHA